MTNGAGYVPRCRRIKIPSMEAHFLRYWKAVECVTGGIAWVGAPWVSRMSRTITSRAVMHICQVLNALEILSSRFFAHGKTLTTGGGQLGMIENPDTAGRLDHNSLTGQLADNVSHPVAVEPELGREEIHCKGEGLETREIPMGLEPACEKLAVRVKAIASD